MNVIIVGCGKVGYIIARNLSVENDVDITIIDHKQDSFEKVAESIDAMLVKGNGLNVDILTDAGAKNADLLISVTDTDETNVLCCITAKHLGTKHTVARVRNPEYALDLNKLWKELGLDMIINPEQETAREISRLLRFPSADGISTFVNGRVELVSFPVSEAHDFFVNKSVSQIFYKKKMNILLAAIKRDNTMLIPHGELVFESNDVIMIIGRPSHIMDFFALIGKNTDKIKNAVIIGGSKITYYLVTLLQRHSSNIAIKIIERDKVKCEEISERFPRCLIINGDGTDEDILSSEIIDRSGAIICLTDRDEENAVIALYSMQLGIRKVIIKIDHINQNMVNGLEIGSIVSPKNITSGQIIRYVRGLNNASGENIRTIYKIFDNDDDRIEAIEFNIRGYSKCLNIPIKELKLKKGILIGCIVRNSNIIIPTGESVMQDGDSIIIIAKNENLIEIDDILIDRQR